MTKNKTHETICNVISNNEHSAGLVTYLLIRRANRCRQITTENHAMGGYIPYAQSIS